MNIQTDDIAIRINELHDSLNGYMKLSVKTAIEIGMLLSDVKLNLEHGEFILWIKNNCIFDDNTAYRYMKCFKYNSKIPNVGNLNEAYKQIEIIEKEEKQTERQRKDRLINEYTKTGVKPDGWDRSLDYEYNKRKKEDDERTKRIESIKERSKIAEGKKAQYLDDIENEKKQSEERFKRIKQGINELGRTAKETLKIKQEIKMTVNDESKFINALNSYILELETDTERLMTLHNIIKYCKVLVNQYQEKSIRIVK